MKNDGKKPIADIFGDLANYKSSSTEVADWGSVPTDLVCELIGTVTSRGGAVRFGYTRDGGAYSLGVYYGTGHRTFYCRGGEDVIDFLKQWVEFYAALPNTRGKSPESSD